MAAETDTPTAGASGRLLPTTVLLLASFLEGAAVMVIELSGAKAVAPYYGTSLYVWGSVLGATIGALAIGYFLGGFVSRRYPGERSLFFMLIMSGVFASLAPYASVHLFPVTELLDVRLGSLAAVMLYLLPAVVCLGAVSPIIAQLINRHVADTGRSAGTVYAISTSGGILATFLAGYYLIPELGLRVTGMLAGGALTLPALAGFIVVRGLMGSAGSAGRSGAAGHPRRSLPAVEPDVGMVGPARRGTVPAGVLLGVAFVEGGTLMVMELLGARITAPYYGASLYVWTSVLATTLAALALGYFVGGQISRRYPGEATVFRILIAAAFLTAIAPLIAPQILMTTDSLGVRGGSLVSCLIYLLPPVTCMGMVTPVITRLVNRRRDSAGQSTGIVYAVSTVGGVLATFFAGFYLIPQAGIIATAFMTAGLLAALSTAYFVSAWQFGPVAAAAVLGVMAVALRPVAVESANARVLYRSSGVLGEWTVLDYGPRQQLANNVPVERRLLLNGIDQTYTQVGFEPLSLWRYPHKIAAYASMKPEGSRALLLGMGGGSVAYELKAMGFNLDIVELDGRIPDIVERYFRYDPAASRLYIDDARHFLRTSRETYDVVIIDLLIGEVQPTHVFSLEGFADLKKRLRAGALVIINFQGYINNKESSLAPRSIYRTLQAAGFYTQYYIAPADEDVPDDIFFLASLAKQDYRALMQDLRYNKWFTYDHFDYDDLIRADPLRMDDAHVLVDDKPNLELLNAQNILQWRARKVEEHLRPMLETGVQLFR